MKIAERAIDKLANAMRIYAEANARFDGLKKVDLQEAIDNLDRSFEAKLEAFHSLYDIDKAAFDYFENADTSVILLLRNAIHHRDHELFSSWNETMAQEGGPLRFLGAEFLIASHYVVGGGHVANQLYKAEDFLLRVDSELNSPALESKMSPKNRSKIADQLRADLRFNELLAKANAERYPTRQIYLNVIPIFISAVCRTFKSLKARGASFAGFDASTYEMHFTDELQVDLSVLSYKTIRIR
ncbi:hypothetical protein [Mesorhizobium erdmanii]|uniref:hypothetical protein n=1 Tax=Mesorhizobium erdmanii TaxID=1777866 RepID=UPI00047C1871|nr:hypothetical protein [Mesorhizobium erdmanii]